MKTIGVLGGLGPQATMDFEARVHRVAQQLIPPEANSGYPPMVVYYCRFKPFVATDGGAPELPLRPDRRLLEAAAKIGGLADFIVVTSNLPHLFRAEIEQAAGCEFLSMIDLVVAEVQRRGWRRAAVPGMGDPVIYTQPLNAAGIAAETLAGETRTKLDDAILRLMEGRENAASVRSAHEALNELRTRGVDGTILACTEIPLLLDDQVGDAEMINPLQLLAEAAVRQALG